MNLLRSLIPMNPPHPTTKAQKPRFKLEEIMAIANAASSFGQQDAEYLNWPEMQLKKKTSRCELALPESYKQQVPKSVKSSRLRAEKDHFDARHGQGKRR
jgi:hypothetical protein